ncbi:uncharacterized protein DFL_006466 [Arthrobotrys flagrans]|uniref:5'-3' DNA helicase ZGRF1-like N-terminal domain-containing protein n=1 Tax=Arthrobotrys flagrans TaxID=97331 RepID=A0A437A0E6_ARTFL|nr:hypothetical protein DFL_006466 [Arthrobotrys flagrans]
MSFTSIPLTSHSAPIDEYIVLWTADKYKKLKKWHDGYLRYHTFNKRLMVYDHLMNKVCDKFLPEPEQMDVGDELIFDSHLVTIEDIKGRQAQDLRPLFEKTVDRRRERGSTATPVRTAGNPGSSRQSPTPTLLRSIQSRPSTGHGRPVYPSPAPRPSPKEPGSNVAVPQKRASQGPPVVQKISYKPFKVSRVEDNNPTPARPTTKPHSDTAGKNDRRQKGRTPPSPDFELATNLLDADDDVEILELDLERGDFATRPRPPSRVRPNPPPPFKPPRPQSTVQKTITQQLGGAEEAPPLHPPAPTVAPVSQTTNPLRSSPRIPPSTITTNYSQELLSSPSFRSRPNPLPVLAHEAPKKDASSPIQSPSPVSSPNPPPEKIQESGRLTLPSATSRNRRKLLCGPSGRRNSASKMVSLSRPVSTLSILETFPKDNGPSEPVKPGKAGKKSQKEARLSVPSRPEGPNLQKNSPVDHDASKQPGYNQPGKSSTREEHWKPLWNYNNDPRDSASTGAEMPRHVGTANNQVSKQDDKSNTKSQKKIPELCIFSSDEEDPEVVLSKPASKRTKTSPPSDSDSSADEFEPMTSSAVPKNLVGQSRNAKLQSRQAISEASRVWRVEERAE